MRFLKTILRFLVSRRLWIFIGLLVFCWLIWVFGPIVRIGETAPLGSELARMVVIGLIVILWLVSLLISQLRAARANQLFVTELAEPQQGAEPAPGEENVAEVNEKFQSVLGQMKRSKLGNRKFLREMPWYVIIGPPGTGKTTALRQSGLHFPIDLSDDLKGVGGTRNCDWFFTEDAVMIDTAGRYVQQESDPEVDAAEWRGFLDLLKKHRGRRALNGVILTLSVQELLGGEDALRAHGREIRKRLTELQERLQIRLPVYLVVTKADLIPGFEAFFGDLPTREREQVWGVTLPPDERLAFGTLEDEIRALFAALEERTVPRMAEAERPGDQAAIFRFPAQAGALVQPLRSLIEIVFGESRYEESAWLRGFYLTSATQEGSPIDRLVGALGQSFGLSTASAPAAQRVEKRSFFLRNLITEVIFPEAGLGVFDPGAETRRTWIWRGTLAGAVLAVAVGALLFTLSFLGSRGAITEQEQQLRGLQGRLANVASRQAPIDPPDLDLALDAVTQVAALDAPEPGGLLGLTGPSAAAELAQSERIAYERTLRNVLEPRMLALLEATMWRQIRDPDYLLGALKVYQMMTGLSPVNQEFMTSWWVEELPLHAPVDPFPTQAALDHQLAALERLAADPEKLDHDPELVSEAVESVCAIPLSVRAYNALIDHPQVEALPDWIPAEHYGPKGDAVLTRISGDTFRIGLNGAFTFDGFHETVLPLIPEVAAQAALDRTVFSGGCSESAGVSVPQLEADMLKLYYEDFIGTWDGFLRDVRLAPLEELSGALAKLKDLSSADSALKRLLIAAAAETHLTRTEDTDGGGGPSKGTVNKALSKLGKIGKLAKKSQKLVKTSARDGGEEDLPGAPVAEHFKPIRGTVEEVDGQAPLIEDVVAALTALTNELQTILNTPNPQQALAERGGLPELTGGVANVARTLPDPVDDLIAGIADEAQAITTESVIAQLNARWKADVLPFCTAAISGRYPFDRGSGIDVNIADFQRLFGPGGLIDSFTDDKLLPFIDTASRPWKWRNDYGRDDSALEPFERARAIRDALFPGGAGPLMSFTLEPKDLSPNASRVTLNVDGQQLVYFNSAIRPQPMTWPGKDGTNLVTLSFAPVDGSPEVITSETGSWAWLRMIRGGRLQATSLPELFRLRLGFSGYAVDMELRAASVDNPFDLSMFGDFQCPQGL